MRRRRPARLRAVAAVLALLGCRGDDARAPSAPAPADPPAAAVGGSVDRVEPVALEAPGVDDPSTGEPQAESSGAAPVAPPADLPTALALLGERGFGAAADIIDARVRQRSPKLRLSEADGLRAARYLLDRLATSSPLRRLHQVMPHSTVELVRAIEERGVSVADAEDIARYLLLLVEVLDFERLRQFDINHSHVTGRDWPDIDYSGEGMTWQGQRRYWAPRGVVDFKRAGHIDAYMRQAYRMPHFARVYRPRGDIADLVWPTP